MAAALDFEARDPGFPPTSVDLEFYHPYFQTQEAYNTFYNLTGPNRPPIVDDKLRQAFSLGDRALTALLGNPNINFGGRVRPVLFMDDTGVHGGVAPDDDRMQRIWQRGNVGIMADVARRLGYSGLATACVHYGIGRSEAMYLGRAEETLEGLAQAAGQHENLEISANGRFLIDRTLPKNHSNRKVRLRGKDGHSEWPSCEVVDATVQRELYIYSHTAVSVVIMPEGYREQQERVRHLLSILTPSRWAIKCVRAYYDHTGRVQRIDSWGDGDKSIELVHSVLAHALA